MGFQDTVGIPYGQEKVTSTTKRRTLGTRGVTPDGRVFYYARNGATALTGGRVIQAKIQEGTNTHAVALTPSTAIGDWTATALGIPVGRTTIGVVWVTGHTSGEFTDGYMVVETTPGTGTYRIVEDATGGNSATATVVRLHPDDGIADAALTTVSKLGFYSNPYSSVIVAPTTINTNIILGVAPVGVPVRDYFWLQTYGPASVQYDSVVAAVAGQTMMGGLGATAGNVMGVPLTTDTTTAAINTTANPLAYQDRTRIGYALVGIPDDGDLIKVMLTIRA